MAPEKCHLIVAGAQKSGTTWVHNTLEYQNEFYCPPSPQEIHFFDEYFSKGFEWYKSIYKHAEKGKVTFDVTPDYIYNDSVPRRMKEFEILHNKGIKILIILRDPIDRAISAYKMKVREGAYNLTLSEALEVDANIVYKSKYKKPLKEFKSLFDKYKIKIFIMEEIFKDSKNFLEELRGFVQAEDDLLNPYEGIRVNASSEGKSYHFARLVSTTLRRLGFERAVHEVKRSPWAQYLRQDASQGNEPVVDEHGLQLLHEELSDEAREVTDLIGRPDVLDIWDLC